MPTQISVTIGAIQFMFLSGSFVLALLADGLWRAGVAETNEEFRSHRSRLSINERSLRKSPNGGGAFVASAR